MKAFINTQFGDCPLVWMFHSRKLNNRINNIHERALRIVFNDDTSSSQTLLKDDKSIIIHIRNILLLANELYGVANDFPLEESLRYPTDNIFKSRNVRTASYGAESLAHLGSKIWAIVLDDLKSNGSLKLFMI